MTKIITSENRIIFDGHARTKEECETISLMCEELSKSDKFKTVKYESGYAEFEKVGKADELKFAPNPGSIDVTMIFDSHITKVICHELNNSEFTVSGQTQTGSAVVNTEYVFAITLETGYVLDTVTLSRGESYGTLVDKTDTTFTILASVSGIYQTITLTSKLATSRKSIDLTTLPGWSSLSSGSYSITIVAKADGYRDSEPSAAVSVEKAAEPVEDPFITFTGETSDFTLTATNKEWDGTVEYSTDKTTWTTWNGTAISSSNKKLYLRGSGNTKFYTSKGAKLSLSAKAGCSGNLNTLLEYSNPPTTLSVRCYSHMFNGCTNLTTAPELPATTLATYCYHNMFQNCTSLTQAPALPATTLTDRCYGSMFYGCTNLTTAPALPATTLTDGCYNSMFWGCTSLTQAPALPATTLTDGCYGSMFYGCTSLTQAPALPATTLAATCYRYMFQNCTSLTQAPALPATTLAVDCYFQMFYGCTNLTTAPALPAATLAPTCYAAMFRGCTSLTQAPALPATRLANSCYSGMFLGCTSLTQAPALPATTLAPTCYRNMFRDCTNLKISATQSSKYPTAWRIPSSGTISSTSTDWNGYMLNGTGGTFTSDPSINTTYYGAW